MRPLELSLTNFQVWTGVTIDFRSLSCAVVTGPNGSGKSAIFDAILVALFGRATKAGVKGMDEYITTGKTECQVELLFEVEERTYRIVRSRGREKNLLDLFELMGSDGMLKQWDVRSGSTVSETQAKIEALVRMDYKTFTASSIVLQNQADAFTRGMEDADRRQVLSRILGLDLYDELLKAAKAEVKAKTPLADQLQARVREMGATDSAETLQPLLETAKADLRTATEALTKAQREYNQSEARAAQVPLVQSQVKDEEKRVGSQDEQVRKADEEMGEAQATVEGLTASLTRKAEVDAAEEDAELLKPLLKELEDGAQEQVRLNKRIAEVSRVVTTWQVRQRDALTKAEMAVTNAEKVAAEIDTVPCAGCGLRDEGPCQENCKYLKDACLAREELPKFRTSLEGLKGKECPEATEVDMLQKALADLGYDADAHAGFRRSMAELEPKIKLKPLIARAEAEIVAARKRIEGAKERRQKIVDEMGTGRRKLRELRERLAELAPLVNEIAANKRTLDVQRDAEGECRMKVGRLEQRLSDAQKTAVEKQKAEERLADARQELQALDLLAQAFGPKGIPAAIQKNVVPEIEILANKMLERLARGRFQVELKTEREGRSTGTEQEILKVVVYDRGVERGYLTYSGAERFMIDIALRCAISHFLANRAGAEVRLFVLDEGLGCCDPSNRDAVVGALLEISKDFGLVLVITHLDELKDAFPQQIKVSPGAEGSTVEVVA